MEILSVCRPGFMQSSPSTRLASVVVSAANPTDLGAETAGRVVQDACHGMACQCQCLLLPPFDMPNVECQMPYATSRRRRCPARELGRISGEELDVDCRVVLSAGILHKVEVLGPLLADKAAHMHEVRSEVRTLKSEVSWTACE